MGSEIDRMYQDLVFQRYKIEAKTIQNLLTLTLTSPLFQISEISQYIEKLKKKLIIYEKFFKNPFKIKIS